VKGAAILGALLLLSSPIEAKTKRSRSVRAHFQQSHPCPSTGKKTGACPGWVVDHKIPLCAGGADAVGNLQWQSVEAAKQKDKLEREQCRR